MTALLRASRVEALFPPGVVAFELHGGASQDELFPAERDNVARAVEKRVKEFAAGRVCARAGLAALGVEPAPILAGSDRAPVWPAGVVGSITHTGDYCLAVVAHAARFAALGVDAERRGQLDRPLWRLTLRPEERSGLEALEESQARDRATLLFSAKEAFYKCQYALTRSWVGFEDVSVECAGESFELTVLEPTRLIAGMQSRWVGRFSLDETLVVAGVAADRAALSP